MIIITRLLHFAVFVCVLCQMVSHTHVHSILDDTILGIHRQVPASQAMPKLRHMMGTDQQLLPVKPVVRYAFLYHQRSHGFLSADDKGRVHTVAEKDAYSYVQFTSRSLQGHIQIYFKATKRYLCFNEKGRLTASRIPMGSLCLFREMPFQRFTELESAFDSRWYVAFNRTGHGIVASKKRHLKMPGQRPRSSKKCMTCFVVSSTLMDDSRDEMPPGLEDADFDRVWRTSNTNNNNNNNNNNRKQRRRDRDLGRQRQRRLRRQRQRNRLLAVRKNRKERT